MIHLTTLQNTVPAMPVAIPLLGSALLAALRKQLPRPVADSVALLAAAANTTAGVWLLLHVHAQTLVYWFGNWYPRGSTILGITFVIDPVAAGLSTLCGALTFLALLFAWKYVDSGSNHSQPLMLVFLAGMSGFCLTGDLFNLFVWFELMSTAAFALTGLKTAEPAPLQGAFNFAVTNTVAAFMVLTGIAMLYAVTGALNMAQIGVLLQHRHDPLVLFACALITCGFFTKGAVAPFHMWLPDAHAVSPTPVCVLFSGVMVELGLYAVQRIYSVIFIPAFDDRASTLRNILVVFGVLTAVLGGMMCYAEHHIKRLLAFSTISHTGLMLIAMAIGRPLATAGFLLYLLGHACVKSALFFVSGILLHRHRTASEPALFAKGRQFRLPAALWFAGGLGLAGLPGFATALGEALADNAAEKVHLEWLSWIFVVSGLLTAAAVFRVGMHTFFGWGTEPISDHSAKVDESPETKPENREMPWWLLAPPLVCAAAATVLFFTPHLRETVLDAAHRMTEQSAYLHSVYAGTTAVPPLPEEPELSATKSGMHGVLAAALGILLALSSVFRMRLSRALRLGAFLEGPLAPLRALQSGHVGDYVTWLTVGTAVMGACFVALMR
jgi:multicomponent Na+:H+ antiporter subunit D